MPAKKVKVAVTGLGVSWESFLKEYVAAPETELVLLHDINAEWARKVSDEYGGVPWTTDFGDVLKSDADMVDVSTPNHVHAEQAIAALEAGKHVLCQKPMAPTVADCRRMVEAAHRTGKTLGMFMCMLGEPIVRDVRRMHREGYFGKVASVRIRSAHRAPFLEKGRHGWRARKENVGGGSFMQLGVHLVNYIEYALEQSITSVTGYAKNLYCRHSIEGEDVVAAAGELESGALITMDTGYSSVGNSVEIYGTEGHFVRAEREVFVELARDFEGDVVSYKRPSSESATVRLDLAARKEQIATLHAEMNQNRAFARAILAGKPAPVSAEAGMRDVAIVQAIYRSSETGRRVSVDEILSE